MIANALNNQKDIKDEKALADIAKKANIKIPSSINALFTKEIKHTSIIEKTQIESEILKFIRS
jgi:threonine synthase